MRRGGKDYIIEVKVEELFESVETDEGPFLGDVVRAPRPLGTVLEQIGACINARAVTLDFCRLDSVAGGAAAASAAANQPDFEFSNSIR